MTKLQNSTSDFINVLRLIDIFQPPLAEINIQDEKGIRKKQSLFYKVTIENANVCLEGYLVSQVESSNFATKISAEEDFMYQRHFWVGEPKVVFNDYNGLTDKKLGSMVWAATTYRSSDYESFYIDLNQPIVKMVFPLKQLERLNSELPANRVSGTGLSELARSTNATGTTAISGLTTTITDTILDVPPEGLRPTGI